jgi:carboxyl-terminal processing protease
MKKTGYSRTRVAVMTTLAAVIFAAGVLTGAGASAVRAEERPAVFEVFWEAWDLVVENFVDRDRIDYAAMTYGAIRGMLETLGDENHTGFFSPMEAEQQASDMQGEFEGIGAYVDLTDGVFSIVAPIHGSPAEAAGILAGDIVLAVNGVPIKGMQEWEVVSQIRGPEGTEVTLTILHPDADEPVDITVERGRILIDSVLWSSVPGTRIAYLQITQFADDTDFELRQALEEIVVAEPAYEGILLDLRNNPGGYLQVAVNVASQFLEEGDVVLYDRDAEGNAFPYVSYGRGLAREIPMVALTNPGTASAGEILAGALQQNGRAKLVGETTLGTGTVLLPYTLSDGSVLRLGVSNWLTPNQELLKGKGVTPDTVIKLDPAIPMLDSFGLDEMNASGETQIDDPQFKSALLLLRLQMAAAARALESQ